MCRTRNIAGSSLIYVIFQVFLIGRYTQVSLISEFKVAQPPVFSSRRWDGSLGRLPTKALKRSTWLWDTALPHEMQPVILISRVIMLYHYHYYYHHCYYHHFYYFRYCYYYYLLLSLLFLYLKLSLHHFQN